MLKDEEPGPSIKVKIKDGILKRKSRQNIKVKKASNELFKKRKTLKTLSIKAKIKKEGI